jgi:hypothetical protein
MKLIDKLKELFMTKSEPVFPEKQEKKPNLIREYDAYEITLWGAEESLEELKGLLERMADEQGYMRASDVMKALGIPSDDEDENIWWDKGYMKDDEDEEEESKLGLVVTEFTKKDFQESRILKVCSKLENKKGITSYAYERVFLLDI